MTDQEEKRFKVIVEEGQPHGDLFELEQSTYFYVVDTQTSQVVMAFKGEMEASLSTSTGQWDNYRYYGTSEVTITPDETMVKIKYHDGREEMVELPR